MTDNSSDNSNSVKADSANSDLSKMDISKTNSRINKNAGIVAFFTLLSRILGAAREFIMLHVFGAGAVLDAFIVAFTIPNVLRRLTADGSLAMIFVPLYIEIKEQRSVAAARLFAQKVISLVIFGTTILTGLGILFSTEIVLLFASGFTSNPEKFSMTVDLTQIMFPYIIFMSLMAIAGGMLNSEQKFASPAAAPILLSACIIITATVLSPYLSNPIQAVAWSIVIAGILQLILQIPFLLQIDQSLAPKSFLDDPDIKRLLLLMAPTLFGVAVYLINMIILRSIGSTLPDGHISYFNLVSRLQEFVISIFAFSFATASLPEFSKQTGNKDWEKAFSILGETISSSMFLVLPATAGFIAFALPIIAMLALHGEFNWQDTLISAQALQVIAIGIPALALIRILVAIFFAMKDTKTPVIVATISMVATAISGWYFSQRYQVAGLTLALTIGLWVQALLLALMLKRKSLAQKSWFPLGNLIKYSVLSLGIATAVYQMLPFGDWQQGPLSLLNWTVFISVVLIAVLLYIAVLAFFKDAMARAMVRKVLRQNA